MGEPAIDELKFQAEECMEVCGSFQYFLDKYCWIEDKNTFQAIPFKLWPKQISILPKFLTALFLIILKARQLGLTWLTAAYCLWLAITRPLQQILIISMGEREAQQFLIRVKFILDRLPGWMVPKIVRESSEILEFRHTDESGNRVNSIIQSLPTVQRGAQSTTPTLLVIDESCWNQYFKKIYSASEPGIAAAGGRIIIISNSIKHAPGWGFTRDLYVGSMKGENIFKRIFLSWKAHPHRPSNFLELEQLKGKSEEDISEHYPETEAEAISVAGGSYFGKVLARHTNTIDGHRGRLEVLNEGKKNEEIKFVPDPRGIIEVWRYPYRLHSDWDGRPWKRRYCAGGDVSEGLGQSYSVGYFMDRVNDDLACRLRSNRLDAVEYARQMHLLSKWYDNALLCIERTGAGQTTVKELKKANANQYVQLIAGKVGSPVTKKFGWDNNSTKAKHELCGDLKQWLKVTQGGVYCSILLDECSTFILTDANRLEPEEGKFADCVIAAGCMVQADSFVGKRPEQVPEQDTGWLKKWKKGEL